MSVKSLVSLYETRAAVSPVASNSRQASVPPQDGSEGLPRTKPRTKPRTEQTELKGIRKLTVHPLLRRREPSNNDDLYDDDREDTGLLDPLRTQPQTDPDTQHNTDELTSDVTDALLSVTGRSDSRALFETNSSNWHGGTTSTEAQGVELDELHSKRYAFQTSKALSGTDFASEAFAPALSVVRQHPLRPISNVPPIPNSPGTHAPVPLLTIIARKAAPLYLPRLDKYIAALPAPNIPSVEGQETGQQSAFTMFPPMECLAASGKTLADLEHNSEIAPAWRNRNAVFSTLTSIAIGITGSSVLASFYSVQGFFDTIQIFALILSSFSSHTGTEEDRLRELVLVRIPNILAFNFAKTLTQSIILLVVEMIIAGLLLYYFYRVTSLCVALNIPEGQQQIEYPKNSWLVVLVSFVLTVVYLPLSTMAVHVLVWSDDLWVVPNPYTNATTNPPDVAPLGPPDEYRATLDFCYTTTMELNEINYAPVIVIIALICFLGLTIWFPIHLYRTIKLVVPIVDPFTELGARRSTSDMDREYQRLLDRDRNPLSFLYNGFRRGWGAYESIFLLAKLTALLITAVIDPDNCLFRTLSRTKIDIARQAVLLAAMLIYFLLQCIYAPFLDPVNNASEWTSRMNYVLTSTVALCVSLNVPGENILNGVVLYIIYIVTYGLSFYFAVIDMDVMRRLVKRIARRIDFSIDMFSPRLDLSPSCPHTRRRIWQESITTLVLTNPDCEIPKNQLMEFSQAPDNEFPPYLLNFAGTPSERLVENLKILRDVGSRAYYRAVGLITGPENVRFREVEEIIQNHFVGPDCYYKPLTAPVVRCTNHFGNAWWIPFPPTLVIRYDDGPLKVLQEVSQFELYLQQNSSPHIQRKREIRVALRALDGQTVVWPYDYVQNIGARDKFCCFGRRYGAKTVVHYETATLNIVRCGHMLWEGTDLGSGFNVQLTYSKDVKVDGSIIGLTDDCDLTQPLARFLTLNELLVAEQLPHIEAILRSYRHHSHRECQWKLDTLTYQFLTAVYNQPRKPVDVIKTVLKLERDERVRDLMVSNEGILDITYERFCAVSTSELATWWYIFWDDLWRRNWETISALQTHATDFDPHFPTSIAYTPLPRPALESFLTQRGLLHKKPKWDDFFDAGFLNKMYLRMNDIAFHGTHGANILHLGDDKSELDMEEIDEQTLIQPSAFTLGTGAGTDYDDQTIRARPTYRWEGILEDSLRETKARHRPFLAKLAVWFGVSPFWRAGVPSQGIALDVRLVNGRYVLFEDGNGDGTSPPPTDGSGPGVV